MASESNIFPDCWNDDERMGYLFSEFRENRQVNPRDWDNKLKFWSELVVQTGRAEKSLVVSIDELSQKFRRKGVLPQCLNGVLKEMFRTGQLVRVDDLKASTAWLSWGVNTFVRRPLRWAVSSFFQQPDVPPRGEFVTTELLKVFGESLLERHHQNVQCASTDHVVDYTVFKEGCADLCRDDATFDIVLLYLQKKKDVFITTTDDNTRIIKFAAKGVKSVAPVTDTELGVLRLKKTIASMQLSMEILSDVVQQQDRETRQYLRKGLKSSAKSALRRKKLAQKKIESTESTLDTLQQLEDRLQSAESERMIMEAYRAGAEAVKKKLADNGLTPEAVDDTMSDIQEVMELCNEIDHTIVSGNKTINETVAFGVDIDLDSLESELESLISGDTDKTIASSTAGTTSESNKDSTERSYTLPDLPSIPTGTPTSPDTSRHHRDDIRESMTAS